MQGMDYWNIIAQTCVTMVAKRETSFSTHQFERLWKRALDNERSLLLNLWDVCQKSTASSRSAVAADLLRTCRVDNITTLRTGKEEDLEWNLLSAGTKVSCKFTFSVLLQIQERSSHFSRTYRLVHRAWQEDITCGDCIQDRDSEKRQG